MSSLQKSGVSEKSSISEMISLLRCSFRKEIYDDVERLLVQREGKLISELQDWREKYDLLRQNESIAVTKEIVGHELNSSRAALDESLKQVNALRAIGEQACMRHSKAQRQLESVSKELEKMEEEKDAEMTEKINEIAKANEEALEKLRMDGKKNLEDLMSQVDSLQEEVVKELEFTMVDNATDDCQQMDVEAEGGLPVSSSEVTDRSVSTRQFNNGVNGLNGKVGAEEMRRSIDQTTTGGHLTTEDLQNVISAAVKNAITTLIPAAVTNRSLSPLEASSGINDQNEARNVDQITPEALGEAIRPRIPAPICSQPLFPQAAPDNNRSSCPREIIEIDDSEGENSDSQTQKRQRSILDSHPFNGF